jgi:lipopolysaccharide export system protein LptC
MAAVGPPTLGPPALGAMSAPGARMAQSRRAGGINPPATVRMPPRPAGTSGATRRMMVRALKRVLPATAIVLLTAIALWPQWQGADEARRFTFRLGGNPLTEPMRMREARFRGIDEQGRPYTVTASEAMQLGNTDDTIDLTDPKGDITLQDGTWMLLQADHGLYYRQPGLLELDGNVVLNHDAGYEVRTERASIDLRGKTARGDRPVEGQGPFGTIEGQGFEAEEAGKVIIVTGPATLVIQGTRQ